MIMTPEKLKIEAEINKLIQEGEVDDAARLAEQKGLFDKAVMLYRQASDFRSMGRIYERQGELKKAMLAYKEGKIYDLAAKVAEKLGEKKKAEFFNGLYQRQEFPAYNR